MLLLTLNCFFLALCFELLLKSFSIARSVIAMENVIVVFYMVHDFIYPLFYVTRSNVIPSFKQKQKYKAK